MEMINEKSNIEKEGRFVCLFVSGQSRYVGMGQGLSQEFSGI